jgi:hypothetical protein
MSKSSFYIYLAIVSFASLLVNFFVLDKAVLLKDYLSSGLLGILIFIPLSIIIFNRGNKLFAQADKSSFISWVMAGTLIKLFVSLIVLIIFARVFKPSSNYFIAPYFIFYLVYFIFETAVLMRLTKK